jgi:hypothetical protein
VKLKERNENNKIDPSKYVVINSTVSSKLLKSLADKEGLVYDVSCFSLLTLSSPHHLPSPFLLSSLDTNSPHLCNIRKLSPASSGLVVKLLSELRKDINFCLDLKRQ